MLRESHPATGVSRRDFLKAGAAGTLTIGFSMLGGVAHAAGVPPAKIVAKDEVDSFLVLGRDGRVTVYVGKVDLGTGTRTALSQIAADELDVAFDRITMIMGDTGTTPDQWLTGANLTIQQGGGELRRACASARAALVSRAAERLKVPAADLVVSEGVVRVKSDPARSVTYADLIGDRAFNLKIDQKAPLKPHGEYKVIGKPIPRVDIPEKVTGQFVYVHDVVVPGMLHARVIRPDDLGAKLLSFDETEARRVRGFVQTVRKGDFLAVVAKDEWSAIKAAQAITANWGVGTGLPEKSTVFQTWRQRHVAKEEVTQNAGDTKGALAAAGVRRIAASYDFAVQTHASLGPSCAVADFQGGKLTVWTASQATHSMVDELAGITGIARGNIRCVYHEGSGCYGRNGHEDATADAAVIAQAIGKPVRVQWMRIDETARAPKSPPRAMDFVAALDASGNLTAWDGTFHIALNHIAAFKPLDFPLLAATELGQPKPGNWVGFLFQNSGQPYQIPNVRVNTRHISEAFFRSSHLRSPGRIENSFANESFMDELAFEAKVDPAAFRLRYLKDPRGIDAMNAVMKLANWQPRVGPNRATSGDVARGRGISYVRYNNATTYVAAVAEVEVSRRTGDIRVTRVCVSHDCGQIINPDGLINQIEGGVIQTVSRVLMEEVQWERARVTSVDWASYPILRFPDAPKVEVALIDRPGQPSWGAGEPTPTAIPAAIANAVFDATGARVRSIPLTAERVKAALGQTVARA